MDFNNIFEYKIEIYKTTAYIEVHEMYENPTRFSPHRDNWTFYPLNNKYYIGYIYYSLVPSFTFRYKTYRYQIKNKNILSLDNKECSAFLNDYAHMLLKYKVQPDITDEGSWRFKGTPQPVPLETAEQAKLDALARFQQSAKQRPQN